MNTFLNWLLSLIVRLSKAPYSHPLSILTFDICFDVTTSHIVTFHLVHIFMHIFMQESEKSSLILLQDCGIFQFVTSMLLKFSAIILRLKGPTRCSGQFVNKDLNSHLKAGAAFHIRSDWAANCRNSVEDILSPPNYHNPDKYTGSLFIKHYSLFQN